MSSLAQFAPHSPLDGESTPSVFRRLMLRFAVAAGLASSMLVWNIGPVLTTVAFVVVAAMLTAVVWLGRARGVHPVRAGIAAGRVSAQVVAAVAVIDLAGLSGVMLVGVCLLLSDWLRDHAVRLARLGMDQLHADPPR